MDESSFSCLLAVADHLVDLRQYFPVGYRPPYLLSPCLTALPIAILNKFLDISSGNGPVVECIMLEMRDLQSRICQPNKEVRGFKVQVQKLAD